VVKCRKNLFASPRRYNQINWKDLRKYEKTINSAYYKGRPKIFSFSFNLFPSFLHWNLSNRIYFVQYTFLVNDKKFVNQFFCFIISILCWTRDSGIIQYSIPHCNTNIFYQAFHPFHRFGFNKFFTLSYPHAEFYEPKQFLFWRLGVRTCSKVLSYHTQ